MRCHHQPRPFAATPTAVLQGAKAGVLQYADNIMEALMAVFACRKSSVHEEAMLAVVRACGQGGGQRRSLGVPSSSCMMPILSAAL